MASRIMICQIWLEGTVQNIYGFFCVIVDKDWHVVATVQQKVQYIREARVLARRVSQKSNRPSGVPERHAWRPQVSVQGSPNTVIRLASLRRLHPTISTLRMVEAWPQD